jgi:hypothetical protein
VMEFFRHCPGCGRRFHIKLESKKLVRLERTSISKVPAPRRSVSQFRGSPVLIVQEGRPIITNIEEFRYAYRCKHCGHEWSERHFEEHEER